MNELEQYQERIFEEIRHVDENGREFWYARELAKTLKYTEWRKFEGVIEKKALREKYKIIGYHVMLVI